MIKVEDTSKEILEKYQKDPSEAVYNIMTTNMSLKDNRH
jgi:hypothetical protein